MKSSVNRIIFLMILIVNFAASPLFAITTGVVFQDVETRELAGATISLPGFEPQQLEEDDGGWITDPEANLEAGTIGIALISTRAGDMPVTFSQTSAGEMIVTPVETDPEGRIAALIDSAGQKILIGYDDSGRVSQLEDPSGQVTSLAYDATGKPAAVTKPAPGTTALHTPAWKNVLLEDTTGAITGLQYGEDGSVNVTDDATALLDKGDALVDSGATGMPVAIRSQSETSTSTEVTSCTPTLAEGPIAIGPKSEIGGGMAKVVDDFAGKMISKGIGSIFGGSGFSFGGGGDDDSETQELDIQENPVQNLQPFTVPGTDIIVNVGAMISDDGKLLISSELENAPGKGTYHSVSLHNMDCQRMQPIRYIPYGLYLEWSLSVQYTYTTERYVDGELVSRTVEQTDWAEIDSGEELLSSGAISLSDKDPRTTEPGIWQQFGFDRATSGLDALGTLFNVGYEDLKKPIAVSINITQPDLDPVMIAPLNLFLCPKDGEISFVPVEDTVEEIKLDYRRMSKFDGGMTQIDPPSIDLSAGEAPVDSVVDDLQPYRPGGYPATEAPVPDSDYVPETKYKMSDQLSLGPSITDSEVAPSDQATGDAAETYQINPDFRLDRGGGMTEIDPPTLELSAGDDTPVDSVVDDLQPYSMVDREQGKPPATFTLPASFGNSCPTWADSARVSYDYDIDADNIRVNKKDTPPRDAGDDFIEAFINAFDRKGE
jgi:YD repeat-containing protein